MKTEITNTPATQPSAAPTELLAEVKRFLEDMHAMPVDWTIRESQPLHAKVSAALAQQAAPGAQSGAEIKTWQQRAGKPVCHVLMQSHIDAMKDEIAELRAALQQRQAPAQAGLLTCPTCRADRSKEPCKQPQNCGMIGIAQQAEAAPAPTADAIPTGRWSKEAEMMESWANIGQADAAVPTAADEQQDMSAPRFAAPAVQHESATDALFSAIMNLPCERTMSHFATQNDMRAYKEGHRDARHAAAELVAEAAGGFREGRNAQPNDSGEAIPASHPQQGERNE